MGDLGGLRAGGRWRRSALAGGGAGRRADRDLDAVVALFEAAARFGERLPGVGRRRVRRDRRAAGGARPTPWPSARRSTTPSRCSPPRPPPAASGGWSWSPTCRTASGPTPGCAGRCSARPTSSTPCAGIDHDPGATGCALPGSRCSTTSCGCCTSRSPARTERLVVTAVCDADEVPSALPRPGRPPARRRRRAADIAGAAGRVTLPAVVSQLRPRLLRAVPAGDAPRREAARACWPGSREGVPGADPAEWYGTAPLSDDRPLRPRGRAGAGVAVHDRVVRAVRAALAAAVERRNARLSAAAAGVGSLVHDVAPSGCRPATEAELVAARRRAGPSLGLAEGWGTERQRARAQQMVAAPRRLLQEAPAPAARRARSTFEVADRLGGAARTGRPARGRRRRPALGGRPQDRKNAAGREGHATARRSSAPTRSRSRRARSTRPRRAAEGPSPATRGGGALIVQLGGTSARDTACSGQPRGRLRPRPGGRTSWSRAPPRAWPGPYSLRGCRSRAATARCGASCPAQVEGRVVGGMTATTLRLGRARVRTRAATPRRPSRPP